MPPREAQRGDSTFRPFTFKRLLSPPWRILAMHHSQPPSASVVTSILLCQFFQHWTSCCLVFLDSTLSDR
ncbi:hypothetical protein MHYP_G00136290 [Metynnis hypsauchen]